ncbi:MAG TPA: hypothetical protein PLD55_04410 [bacterium]|nr:hypothetical protein [bacterium]
MNELTLVIAVIIFEMIKTGIDILLMKKRHQKNEIYQRNIQGNYEFFAEFQERAFESLKAGNSNALKEIKEQNKKLYNLFEEDFIKELKKAEDKAEQAKRELQIFATAIKALEPNDRKKIQYRLERIVQTQKQKPARSDKNKPEKEEKTEKNLDKE